MLGKETKAIWCFSQVDLARANKKAARQQGRSVIETYGEQYPKAIDVLEEGLEDSLSYYDFLSMDVRKVSFEQHV